MKKLYAKGESHDNQARDGFAYRRKSYGAARCNWIGAPGLYNVWRSWLPESPIPGLQEKNHIQFYPIIRSTRE
jgi:hypothetical protein